MQTRHRELSRQYPAKNRKPPWGGSKAMLLQKYRFDNSIFGVGES
jgi:hypothetical protein